MAHDLFSRHQEKILQTLKETPYFKETDLRAALDTFKEAGMVTQSLSMPALIARLISLGMVNYPMSIGERIVSRYSFSDTFDSSAYALSLHRDNFLSMSTALNVRGLSDFRSDFVFVSHEQPPKFIPKKPLQQEAIDASFSKPYRRTKEVGEIKGIRIVQLTPKHTGRFGVESFEGMPVSTPERALVEMIVNIQYFRNAESIISVFRPIRAALNVEKVFEVLEHFDLIYPYHQLAGFYLEQIGFERRELLRFKERVGNLRFYTEKMKSAYQYDTYWGIYY